MPSKPEQHYYSAPRTNCLSKIDIDNELADIDTSGAQENTESADEIIDALCGNDPDLSSLRSDSAPEELSKNVETSGPKMLEPTGPKKLDASGLKKNSSRARVRIRRSPAIDRKTIAIMRSFVPPWSVSPTGSIVSLSGPVGSLSSVSSALCSTTSPSTPIPVWEKTDDTVKVLAATLALLIGERPAFTLNFNLTPETITTALSHPDGFLDYLKRSFDEQLKKTGLSLPYWFAVDVDDDERLHLHGAFGLPESKLSALGTLRLIRKQMKAAWGEWEGPGKGKQLRCDKLYSDGWATYCMERQAAVRKIIGDRIMTINFRKEAKWAYEECRRLMREGP
jgi:hypothetical protein